MAIRRSALRALSGRYLIALAVAAVVMTTGVVTVNYVINNKLDSVKRVNVHVAPAPAHGANYLVLGCATPRAARPGPGSCSDVNGSRSLENRVNSDTVMVVHVEPALKRTLIVSFPRDLWVNIPGIGMDKIDGALSAGPNKTIETLKADFNIDINHYILVDFKSFQEIVNTIGSVPVYFPYAARDYESGLLVPPGCIRLNGFQALAYARSRTLEFYSAVSHDWVLADPTADIGRIARQQQFIRELAGIAVQRSLQDPITANDIVDRVLHYLIFDQNLSKNDVLSLVDAFRTVNPNDTSHLEFQTMPWQTGPDQNGQSVLYVKTPDDQAIEARLRDFTGTSTVTPLPGAVTPKDVKVNVADSTGTSGLAQAVSSDLTRRAGFVAGTTGQASPTLAHTEVHYKPGSIAQGELLLNYLPPSTALLPDNSLKGANVELVLGKGFTSVVIPSGGASVSTPAPTPGAAAQGPPQNVDTFATGGGNVDASRFGTPAPKGTCR